MVNYVHVAFLFCFLIFHQGWMDIAFYPMGMGGGGVLSLGGKVARAWSWTLTSISCRGQGMHGTVPPLPQYIFMAWCLVKRKDNFTEACYFKFHACIQALLFNCRDWDWKFNLHDVGYTHINFHLTLIKKTGKIVKQHSCWGDVIDFSWWPKFD
jgi:hypothetical protein